MDWYEIVVVIVPLIAALWGGWKLWKHIPREVGEALITLADAIEDDRLTLNEVRAIVKRYYRIINAVTKALMKKQLAEFLSETSEWHALWFGFFNAFFRLRNEKLSEELQKDIKNEYHYYTLGFFVARVVQAGLASAGFIFWL